MANRQMAAKNAKAKKYAMQESLRMADAECMNEPSKQMIWAINYRPWEKQKPLEEDLKEMYALLN